MWEENQRGQASFRRFSQITNCTLLSAPTSARFLLSHGNEVIITIPWTNAKSFLERNPSQITIRGLTNVPYVLVALDCRSCWKTFTSRSFLRQNAEKSTLTFPLDDHTRKRESRSHCWKSTTSVGKNDEITEQVGNRGKLEAHDGGITGLGYGDKLGFQALQHLVIKPVS